jgi:class 3 adenylate cyclase
MQRRQHALDVEMQADGLPTLGVGIGVNTGTVIAGAVGGGGRLEYTVVGDAVNLAQRLQSNAAAGEVLATAATAGAAPGVATEALGSVPVKGRSEPVEVFRVSEADPGPGPEPGPGGSRTAVG